MTYYYVVTHLSLNCVTWCMFFGKSWIRTESVYANLNQSGCQCQSKLFPRSQNRLMICMDSVRRLICLHFNSILKFSDVLTLPQQFFNWNILSLEKSINQALEAHPLMRGTQKENIQTWHPPAAVLYFIAPEPLYTIQLVFFQHVKEILHNTTEKERISG